MQVKQSEALGIQDIELNARLSMGQQNTKDTNVLGFSSNTVEAKSSVFPQRELRRPALTSCYRLTCVSIY